MPWVWGFKTRNESGATSKVERGLVVKAPAVSDGQGTGVSERFTLRTFFRFFVESDSLGDGEFDRGGVGFHRRGLEHLHAIGGHLKDDCVVYETAKFIIQLSPDLQFACEKDGTSDWLELQIKLELSRTEWRSARSGSCGER